MEANFRGSNRATKTWSLRRLPDVLGVCVFTYTGHIMLLLLSLVFLDAKTVCYNGKHTSDERYHRDSNDPSDDKVTEPSYPSLGQLPRLSRSLVIRRSSSRARLTGKIRTEP